MIKKFFFTSLFLFSILFSAETYSCTNFIVTKGASTDGSVIITYTADSYGFYGELFHFPAAVYQNGSWLEIYEWDSGKFLGKIPRFQ